MKLSARYVDLSVPRWAFPVGYYTVSPARAWSPYLSGLHQGLHKIISDPAPSQDGITDRDYRLISSASRTAGKPRRRSFATRRWPRRCTTRESSVSSAERSATSCSTLDHMGKGLENGLGVVFFFYNFIRGQNHCSEQKPIVSL